MFNVYLIQRNIFSFHKFKFKSLWIFNGYYTDFYNLSLVTVAFIASAPRAEDRYRLCMKYKRTPEIDFMWEKVPHHS